MLAGDSLVLLAAATVVATAVHSALGFGSGPLLVPVLLLFFEPPQAAVAAVLIGMAVNVMQIVAERQRPSADFGGLFPLWLGAVPGCLAGALAASFLSASSVAAIVAIALLFCAAGLTLFPRLSLQPPASVQALAGVISGASAALTGIFGPLLAIWLLASGQRGPALRDSVGASFLFIGAMTVAVSLAVSRDLSALTLAGMLLVPAALGSAVGRRGAGVLSATGQRRAVLLAVAVAAGVAVAAAM